MFIYDKQIENLSDLNYHYKILSYFHKVLNLITKLMSPIFKDQWEGVVKVKHPIIWYLWKALNVLCTGHLDKTVTCKVSEKSLKNNVLYRGQNSIAGSQEDMSVGVDLSALTL